MALHKTQCPHCFTSYVISDEQYRVSQGMVRCGTCRERFQAHLDTEGEIPKFDPRKVFIEPLTQEPEEEIEEVSTPIRFTDIKNLDASREFSMHSELSIGFAEAHAEAELAKGLSTEKIITNIKAKKQRYDQDKGDSKTEASSQIEASSQSTAQTPPNTTAEPAIQAEPATTPAASVANVPVSQASTPEPDDAKLIDEVDSLIADKLLNENGAAKSSAVVNDRLESDPGSSQFLDAEDDESEAPFSLDASERSGKMSRWLLAPVLLIACVGLAASLVYQLWLQQGVWFNPGSSAERFVTSVASEFAGRVSQSNVALPVRRDLSKMELVSARTRPHPTRSSTILLQVGLINHAEIEQSMPWLELTLFSAQGNLLSRRNLSPEDYAYNNDLDAMMSSREYRRLAIELLAFPKNATGYELKLLSQ